MNPMEPTIQTGPSRRVVPSGMSSQVKHRRAAAAAYPYPHMIHDCNCHCGTPAYGYGNGTPQYFPASRASIPAIPPRPAGRSNARVTACHGTDVAFQQSAKPERSRHSDTPKIFISHPQLAAETDDIDKKPAGRGTAGHLSSPPGMIHRRSPSATPRAPGFFFFFTVTGVHIAASPA